jgi:hypothetical protein
VETTFKKLHKEDGSSEGSADSTGRYRISDLRAKYPAGLKIRISEPSILSEAGKLATKNGVLEVEKVAKVEKITKK